MNKFKLIAGIFMAISLYNLVTVIFTGNGISLVLGVFWLAASAYVFIQYRKMQQKNDNEAEEKQEEQV